MRSWPSTRAGSKQAVMTGPLSHWILHKFAVSFSADVLSRSGCAKTVEAALVQLLIREHRRPWRAATILPSIAQRRNVRSLPTPIRSLDRLSDLPSTAQIPESWSESASASNTKTPCADRRLSKQERVGDPCAHMKTYTRSESKNLHL